MFHKYSTCDFSVPLQISPWTHGPCGEFKSARDVLVLTNPIILLPSSPESWALQSNSHNEKYLTCVKYCINMFKLWFVQAGTTFLT